MQYDLSRKTLEERIIWHMKRVAREELVHEVHKAVRTKLTRVEILQELSQIRDDISLCQRALDTMTSPIAISNVKTIKTSVKRLGIIQRNRARLLKRKFSGCDVTIEYKKCIIQIEGVIGDLVSNVGILEEIALKNRVSVDRYVVGLHKIEGFTERYREEKPHHPKEIRHDCPH